MKKNSLINLFIFLFSVCLFSQVKNKEDLKKLSFDELMNHYFDSKTQSKKLIKYADAYLYKGKLEKKDDRISRGFYLKALLYYNINNKKAIQLLDSVIKYSKNGNDPFFPAAAYCEKGNLLVNLHQYKEALNSFNLGEINSKKNNIDYYYIIRQNIAITKSENLGQVKQALSIYKECYNFYKTKNVRDSRYSADYQSIIFGIADVYKSLKQVDSCSFYNNLGYNEAKATHNENFKYLFVLNEGANQILKKNYKATIDSIIIALPKLKANKNTINIIASYYYYGKALEGLNKKDLAIVYYKKIDSIYQTNKNILTPEFIDGYKFLISYYKDKKDKVNQLKYITIFMSIDSTLNKNYKELDKLLQNEYDIPHLVEEKENLIESLKNKTKFYYWGISCLILIIIALVIYQQNTKKKYRLRFEKIIAESTNIIKEKKENTNTNESKSISIDENQLSKDKIKEVSISEEIVSLILKKLATFENEKGYLNGKVSVKTLSEDFETNSKYLSKIVNEYKNKTFVNYINDLRIDYAVINLQESKTARKFTLQALAVEYGFNNAESFSTAFYKKTGIKPSYFIKELENKTS